MGIESLRGIIALPETLGLFVLCVLQWEEGCHELGSGLSSLSAPTSWTFQPPELWEISVCCLSHPICSTFVIAAWMDWDISLELFGANVCVCVCVCVMESGMWVYDRIKYVCVWEREMESGMSVCVCVCVCVCVTWNQVCVCMWERERESSVLRLSCREWNLSWHDRG